MIKKIGFLLVSFTPLTALSCSLVEETITVINVVDGDTFEDFNENKYRLFGVDTPESRVFFGGRWEFTTGRQWLWADKATKFAKAFLENKKVKVQKVARDDYQRIVAKAKSNDDNNQDLGLELVRNGLAIVAYISTKPGDRYFTDDYKYYEQLISAQYKAWQEEVGIWSLDEDEMKEVYP